MKSARMAVGLTCWVLLSTTASASTPRRMEPTAGANLIAYQLNVGSTMRRDADAEELFANDASGYATFTVRASQLIVKQLETRGIASEPDSLATKARSYFLVGIWGHKIAAGNCSEVYVYYLEAHGVHQAEDGEFGDTWVWTALNSAPAGELASSLLKDLELALSDYLADRPIDKDRETKSTTPGSE